MAARVRVRPLVLSVGLVIGVVGCRQDWGLTGPGGTEPLPLPVEDRGTLLASAYPGAPEWFWPQLAWSPDGSEIYYFGPQSAGPPPVNSPLLAVSTSNGSGRVVAPTVSSPQMLWLSPDGKWLFYSATSPTSRFTMAIYRVATTGGSSETLVDGSGPWFAVSADASTVAYIADSLELFQISSRSRRALQAVGQPIALSPDGAQIVLGTGQCGTAVRVTSLVDGSTRTVWGVDGPPSLPCVQNVAGLRWDQGQLHILYWSGPRLLIRDAATGGDQFLVRVDSLHGAESGWSPDGRRVMTWAARGCVQYAGLWTGCLREQFILYSIDARTGTLTSFGQGNFLDRYPGVPVHVIVSPDGGRVAYQGDGDLYTKAVP